MFWQNELAPLQTFIALHGVQFVVIMTTANWTTAAVMDSCK